MVDTLVHGSFIALLSDREPTIVCLIEKGLSMSPSDAQTAIKHILSFIRYKGLKSRPGFPHYLRLSHHTIDRDKFCYQEEATTLTYRYKMEQLQQQQDQLRSIHDRYAVPPTAGSLLALQDDLSMNAIVAVRRGQRSGVSLQLDVEMMPDASIEDITELDIHNEVTQLGRTAAFTRTKFVNPGNEQLVALGSHVVFMRGGKPTSETVSDEDPLKYPNMSIAELMKESLHFAETNGKVTALLASNDKLNNNIGCIHVRIVIP